MPLPLQTHNPQKMVDSPGQIRRLEKKNVKPTAIRLLVVDAIASAHRAVSLSDLEVILDTVDKSSIFRTLELFVKHHVVHAIDDGSGSVKYEICEGEEECTLDDMHIHFYCTVCHRTFCFKTIHIPSVEIPEGFSVESANYMLKGVCKDCAAKPHCI